MPRDISRSRSPSYRRRHSPSPLGHRYGRRSRRDRSRSPYSSYSYSRKKSRSISPQRRRSRSPTVRRRKSRSPTPKRYRSQKSRNSSLAPTPSSSSPSLGSVERKSAREKLRKEEEERKSHTLRAEWLEITRKWDSAEHKEVRQRNRQNRSFRAAKSGTATYAGGSITIGEHKRKMVKTLGSQTSFPEVFERAFRKDQSFVSYRAQAIKEKFDVIMADSQRTGGDDSCEGEQRTVETAQPSQAEQNRMWFDASSAGISESKAGTSDSVNTEEVSRLKRELAHQDDEIATLKQTIGSMEKSLAAVLQRLDMLPAAQTGLNMQVADPVPPAPVHVASPPTQGDPSIDKDDERFSSLEIL